MTLKNSNTDILTFKGSFVHNLKGEEFRFVKNSLNAVVGPSGSGKTSLLYDSIYMKILKDLSYFFSSNKIARVSLNQSFDCEGIESFGINFAVYLNLVSSFSSKKSIFSFLRIDNYLYRLAVLYGEKICGKCSNKTKYKNREDILSQFKKLQPGDKVRLYAKVEKDNLEKIFSLGFSSMFSFEFDSLSRIEKPKENQDTYVYIDSYTDKINYSLVFDGISLLERSGIGNFIFEIITENQVVLNQIRTIQICENCSINLETHISYELFGSRVEELLNLSFSKLNAIIKENNYINLEQTKKLELFSYTFEMAERLSIDYLNLSRSLKTLSNGELSRLRLLRELSSDFNSILYLVDEPSSGLHPKDIQNLSLLFTYLCRKGATVIFSDHSRTLILESNNVIEMGPGAGKFGGKIMFQGPARKWLSRPKDENKYALCNQSADFNQFVTLKNLTKNNLKIDRLKLPLGSIVMVAGVSGSGKSTLVFDEIFEKLEANTFNESVEIDFKIHAFCNLKRYSLSQTVGSLMSIEKEFAKLYSETVSASINAYTKEVFLQKNEKYLCKFCQNRKKESAYDCSTCLNTKLAAEVLSIEFKGISYRELMTTSVVELSQVFKNFPKVSKILTQIVDFGLGYLVLSQSTSSLSSGEYQRLRLLKFLKIKESLKNNVFLLDEPSRGLGSIEKKKLFELIQYIKNLGASFFIVEHDPEIISFADYIIELGPEAGENGGNIIFSGNVDELKKSKNSIIKDYL